MKTEHDKLIDIVAQETIKLHDRIYKNVHYKRGKYEGEIDVLGYDKSSDIYHFYEIKTHYSSRSKRKAQSQFARIQLAYKDVKFEGYYVSSELCFRMGKNYDK